MDNIEIQYPFWYILICIIIGLSITAVLYYRASYFPTASKWIKGFLAFVRFLAVTILSLLLLSPVLKYSKQESKKPIVIFAQDASASIQEEMDSVTLSDYQRDLDQVIDDLSSQYEVKTFSFGENFRPGINYEYTDRSSNQSTILEYIGDLYGDQNLGAVIYGTDGIYNEGKDPRYANLGFTAPIYSIAMGDTTPDRDLSIRQVFHNNIAYLGDKTSIQIDVTAYNCQNSRSELSVFRIDGEESKQVANQPFTIDKTDFFQTIEIAIPQEEIGLQRFRVSLAPVSGERSLTNNRKDFFIDVIDARQKILILAASPHPDLAALKASLEKNKNYEIETAFLNRFAGKVADYDFIVLHQLPQKGLRTTNVLREINEQKIPRMIVVGNQTNLAGFNQFQGLVDIKLKAASFNEVQAVQNPAFSFFKTSDEFKQNIASFPPLDAPFGDYAVSPGVEVLLKQRIGKIDTDFPLLLIGEENGVKSAIWCAEGIWRWKLFNYLQYESNELFDELISKSVQYVSLKEDKRKFRVFQAKNLLAENEDALFDAELYNQSYQLINEPEVTINLRNSKGEIYTFAFSRKNDSYILDAGKLPVEDYTWEASTHYEGERLTASGQFSVQAIERESYATVANHQMLKQLSINSGGQMLYPDQVSNLTPLLTETNSLKPVYFRILTTRNAIHLKSLFFLLLGLLVIEWGLRRFLGTY